MTAAGPEVQLRCSPRSGGGRRNREPVTFGLPFPAGIVHDSQLLSVMAEDGSRIPLQVQILDRWSDGSIRWALVDAHATCTGDGPALYRVSIATAPTSSDFPPLNVTKDSADIIVDTGAAYFRVAGDGRLTCSAGNATSSDTVDCQFRLIDQQGSIRFVRTPQITCEVGGPMRSTVFAAGSVDCGDNRPLELTVRFHFYAGLPIVRVVATLRNPARATHTGGFWDLGDPGSRYIRDLSFLITPPRHVPWTIFCSPERGSPLRRCADAFLLYQDSSGGDNWNSPNHRNRTGAMPLRYKGYRLHTGSNELCGLRSTPIAQLQSAALKTSIAQRHFWQRFPKAMSAADGTLRLGLLPQEYGDVHELQGGEQITEEFVVSFADEGITDTVLDWVRDPLCATADPEWCCRAEAMPHITPVNNDPNVGHLALINAAIQGDDTFERKRERLDEYGWRNFGDLYADHEAVFHQGRDLFVSHYNNQYDAIAGFAVQYFRSGDPRWFDLLDDLARHVIDIDVYHTSDDKAAYNGGLFWHTAHHIHADLSTHRTYPRSGGASGGPAPEHNYNTGLMLYYFLTGDSRAREAVVSLGQWVVSMDDGDKTPLKWIARGRTGLASATGSLSYHGPGRAPGNSILALLNAFRVTDDESYLAKAEELVRRCSHPNDDIESLGLLDAERRWFYTVFLQALGRYLELKEERKRPDDMYVYARDVLLHYARWMAAHEYPYLDKPEILEFPNETWAAQDMRKSEVFNYASKYVESPERELLCDRSRFFFDYSVSTLLRMGTGTFTRPLVLMLTNGNGQHQFQISPPATMPGRGTSPDFGAPARFTAQKTRALRRLRIAAIIFGLAAGAAGIAITLGPRALLHF